MLKFIARLHSTLVLLVLFATEKALVKPVADAAVSVGLALPLRLLWLQLVRLLQLLRDGELRPPVGGRLQLRQGRKRPHRGGKLVRLLPCGLLSGWLLSSVSVPRGNN